MFILLEACVNLGVSIVRRYSIQTTSMISTQETGRYFPINSFVSNPWVLQVYNVSLKFQHTIQQFGLFEKVTPKAFHEGFNSEYIFASVVIYADSSWIHCAQLLSRLSIRNCLDAQNQLPTIVIMWKDFISTINLVGDAQNWRESAPIAFVAKKSVQNL